MSTTTNPTGDRTPHHHLHHAPQTVTITDAREAASLEQFSRVKRYTLAMAFRMACFLGILVVDGWLRWILLAVAVFLPYVAVLLANQADERTVTSTVEHGAPEPVAQIAASPYSETITGEVVDVEPDAVRTAA